MGRMLLRLWLLPLRFFEDVRSKHHTRWLWLWFYWQCWSLPTRLLLFLPPAGSWTRQPGASASIPTPSTVHFGRRRESAMPTGSTCTSTARNLATDASEYSLVNTHEKVMTFAVVECCSVWMVLEATEKSCARGKFDLSDIGTICDRTKPTQSYFRLMRSLFLPIIFYFGSHLIELSNATNHRKTKASCGSMITTRWVESWQKGRWRWRRNANREGKTMRPYKL